jgi:homoserine dehydrogenase
MQARQADFRDVLKEAQKKGYAEANPSLDVDGIDSAHKLSVLASLMSGQWIELGDIAVDGITPVSHEDIQHAEILGYVIKLLAIAKEVDGELEVRVHPTLIEKSHPLANVSGVYNAIYLKGVPVGRSLFYGRGAGELPTASAVVSDLVDVARNIVNGTPNRIPPLAYAPKEKRIKPVDRVESEYYLRFSVIDTPGVLAKIAGILGKNSISIASVLQRERHEGKVVPVVILTHTASGKSMRQALKEIDRFAVVKRKTVVIPVERES